MCRQPTPFIEDQRVLGPLDLQHREQRRDTTIGSIRVSPTGETNDRAQPRHILTGQAIRHEATVRVADSEDLVELGLFASFFDQRLEIANVIDFGIEEIATFIRRVPVSDSELVDRAIGIQQAKSALIDPLRELEVGIRLGRTAAVSVEQHD